MGLGLVIPSRYYINVDPTSVTSTVIQSFDHLTQHHTKGKIQLVS